jgi:peptide/nickel transport system permease protein
LVQRIVATIPVMGVVALTVFALLHLTPGDPAEIIAGDYATPQDIAKIRAGLGLDKPLLTQFLEGALNSGTGEGSDVVAAMIRGKPVDERLQIRLTVVGVICLLTLMVFATAMDIGRYAEWIKQLFS